MPTTNNANPNSTQGLTGKALDFAIECGHLPSKVDVALENFLTLNDKCLEIKRRVKLLAAKNCSLNVMIFGETGTGKELLAKALHGDRTGKFVDVNCAGIPDTLLESEFFGTVHGAFTGAIARKGYLEEADGGTLFLDEIGDMPLLLQCKLLRVVQEKKARRLGSNEDYRVGCRFVSATNRSKLELLAIANKTFRADLFFRLAGTELNIPPLRDRKEDVTLIVKSLAASKSLDLTTATSLVEDFIKDECFGNVRGLLNKIEEAGLK